MKENFLKNNIGFILPICFLLILSMINMYSSIYVSNLYKGVFLKQFIWIIMGFICMFLVYKININLLIKLSFVFYIIGIISLVLVLIFGTRINGASSWFKVFGISIQPSEIFKFFFIISLSKIASSNSNNKIIKVSILSLIPTMLVFLQPDSGVAFMYLIISFAIYLFCIKEKKYIFFGLSIITFIICLFMGLYLTDKNLFGSLFGETFYYRMDRLLSFKNNSSYQLSNALIGLGSSGTFGFGIRNSKIYVPELITDFVFDLTIFNFGYMMGICLILVYTFLLLKVFFKTNTNDLFYKAFSLSSFFLLLYQITEHIFMNIGLTPITGITLPFLSYGGSSLISYFLIFGVFLKITTNSSSYS